MTKSWIHQNQQDCFDKTENVIIGNNAIALDAVEEMAHSLGFYIDKSTDWLKGEAREVGRRLFHEALEFKQDMSVDKPILFICGGETTVTIRGEGKGGRNQEMALAFLDEMKNSEHEPKVFIFFLPVRTEMTDPLMRQEHLRPMRYYKQQE